MHMQNLHLTTRDNEKKWVGAASAFEGPLDDNVQKTS